MMPKPHLDEVFPCDVFLPKALTGIELQLPDDFLQVLPNEGKVWCNILRITSYQAACVGGTSLKRLAQIDSIPHQRRSEHH